MFVFASPDMDREFKPLSAPTEVDVIGLDIVSDSVPLTLLFIAAKEWILSLWENRVDQIVNITLWEKSIGRNDGFILDVNCIDPSMSTTFYAKMQPATMDTVLIHHLLKNVKCGPDRFHIILLDGSCCNQHGVITEGVKDWTMAKMLTQPQKSDLVHDKRKLLSTTFLLNVLSELGQFANIPQNRCNWGFVDGTDDSVPYPQLSLVDFSRGKYGNQMFYGKRQFTCFWRMSLNYLFEKWEPVCGDMEDLQLFKDRTADLHQSLLKGLVIEDQLQHFPFLQSAQAFKALLQSACDETAQWLHETILRARESSPFENPDGGDNNYSIRRSYYSTYIMFGEKHFEVFRHVPQPDVTGLVGPYKALVADYISVVNEWNHSVPWLFSWFPFPERNDSLTYGVKYGANPVGTSKNVSDTDVVVESAP